MHEDLYVFTQYHGAALPLQLPMAGISYCDDTYRIQRPSYDHYVIEYTLEGSGTLEVNDQVYHLLPGDVYILYNGPGHKYYCPKDTWTKIWFVADGPLAQALFGTYLATRPDVIRSNDISRYMHSIIDLARDKTISYEEICAQASLLLHRILLQLSGSTAPQTPSLPEQVKRYIDDHLDKPLSLDALCETFHYSKNHIIALFRDKYQMTPYVYYERQKMFMAREILANTSVTIAQLSERMAFETPQYFSKCFKKHFGVTPSQWVKKHKNR